MSAISTATAPWLTLRAAADDAARAQELAERLVRMIPPGPIVLHDLGAGTGGMTRWLAPRLAGPQEWILHDGDAGILKHVALDAVADGGGSPIRVGTIVETLEALRADSFAGAALVTASALLDVVTRDEAVRIVAACIETATPALFCLSVTGRVRLDPPDAADEEFGQAFNDHQRRDAGGRRMLGPDAVPLVVALFEQAGWQVRRAPTPWRLGAAEPELIAGWLEGWIGAAVDQRPELEPGARVYLARRRAQLAAGALRITVSHEDVLAWPR